MKTILFASFFCAISFVSLGQSGNENDKSEIQSILGESGHNGIYGGVTFKATEFNDKSVGMAGMRGAWVVNRTLGIGLDAVGLIPLRTYTITDQSVNLKVRPVGGYGGILLEPVLFSNQIVHVTIPVSSGAGWLGYVTDWEEDYDEDQDDYIDGDVFWYVEPGASLEVNVARFFRINVGVSRRIVQDFSLQDTPDNAFDGWAYTLALKFGKF